MVDIPGDPEGRKLHLEYLSVRDSSGDLAGKKRKDPDNPNCKRGGLVRREYRLVLRDYGAPPPPPLPPPPAPAPTPPHRAAPRGALEVHMITRIEQRREPHTPLYMTVSPVCHASARPLP